MNIDFDSIAEAWQKWEEILEPCFEHLNNLLLEKASISESHNVLDLGCGSGIPALLIARRAIKGRVAGIDVSESMLAVASRKADLLGLNNVVFLNHDMGSLPFEAGSFDAVTARFSLMFVQSPRNTVNQVFTVLKEGGRFSVCVWGDPEKNPLPRKVLAQYCDVPSNNREVPGPYRFADKGSLAELMEQNGLSEIGEKEVEIQEVFDSGEQYVQHLLEGSALWGSMLRKMNPKEFRSISDHLIQEAEKYRIGPQVFIPRFACIVYGYKPRSKES